VTKQSNSSDEKHTQPIIGMELDRSKIKNPSDIDHLDIDFHYHWINQYGGMDH
jgi:hypothetical protein